MDGSTVPEEPFPRDGAGRCLEGTASRNDAGTEIEKGPSRRDFVADAPATELTYELARFDVEFAETVATQEPE